MQDDQIQFSLKSLLIPITNLKAIHWIILLGVVVYANSLFNGFFGDDYAQIVTNPLAHSLTNLFTLFTENSTSAYKNISNQVACLR